MTSGKGGVGKTTLSLNIARQLSLHGLQTLIVDFDIHNKGTTGLFLEKVSSASPSIINIVERSNRFDPALTEGLAAALEPLPLTPDESLLLLPASRPEEMIDWGSFHGPNDEIVRFFRELFAQLASRLKIDVVVIDCYGGIDSLTVAAAGIADDLIIINEPDVITFSGTLMLYKYLGDTYAQSMYKPSIHFVINRITSRHSFYFLNNEYQKHLSGLSIRNSILAYLPYDKLIVETFGDYPFFTELLPRSLITKKIKLLIHQLWKEDDAFASILTVPGRKEKRIYRATSETRFADPERIVRGARLAPFLLMMAVAILTLLSARPVESLPYRLIQSSQGAALLLFATVLCLVLIFEPIQIARWSLRIANYRGRKRSLQKGTRKSVHYLVSAGAYCWPIFLGSLSLLIFAGMVSALFSEVDNPQWFHRDISIWTGAVSGFKANGNYRGLRLGYGSQVKAGSTFKNADLSYAQLSYVTLTEIDFNEAKLSHASLRGADLTGVNLTKADLSHADLSEAHLVGAILTKADLSHARLSDANLVRANLTMADLSHAYLWDVNLVGANLAKADLSNANLSGADLSSAKLTQAILGGANLDGARLGRADLTDTDLRNIRNWRTIKSMNVANVYNVQNPPDGFLDFWASRQKMAAVSAKDRRTWESMETRRLPAKDLIAKGEKSAQADDVNDAVAQFREALKQDPNLGFDPRVRARRLAAVALVDEGRRLASQGEVERAIAAFEKARHRDPNVELDPGFEKVDPKIAAYRFAALGWMDKGTQSAERGEAANAKAAYEEAARTLQAGLSLAPKGESLRELLGGLYQDYLFNHEAAYQQFDELVKSNPGAIGHKANLAEASLAAKPFTEAYQRAQELLKRPAASQVLTSDEELAMRLITISSLVLQERSDEADKELRDFVSRYNSIAKGYVPTWTYDGTKNFITGRQMDGRYKKSLLKLIEVLETPTSNVTIGQLEWPTGTMKAAR